MSEFKDIAHKTVAELFDMLKAKEAAIQEMDEVIKLQDADLRKYEKQIEGLKAQLNNMEACYIEKKKQVEELQKTNISLEAGLRKNSKNKQKLLCKNIELQKRIDEALQEVKGLERFTGEDCIADFEVLQGAVSHACKRLEKALRGGHE